MKTKIPAAFLACAVTLAAAPQARANVVNPDFDPDFSAWDGALTDSLSFAEVLVNPDADSHFSIVGGGLARLNNDFDFFEVALFQAFTMPLDAQSISFDYEWSITCEDPLGACATANDPFGSSDIVQAALFDAAHTTLLANLFPAAGVATDALAAAGTATADISSLAGQDVILEFFIGDGDFDEQDWLQIGNIGITGAVPLPGTVPLALLGLAALGWSRARAR